MADLFAGKIVLLTGASGDLGHAVAEHFVSEGATLVMVARDSSGLQTLTSILSGEHLAVPTDVTQPQAVDELVRQAVERFGRVDVLAHTVGGFASSGPVHAGGLDVLDRMYNLNTRPVYLVAGRVAAQMVSQGSGKIVVVLARPAVKGVAGLSGYAASKAAALRIVESMAAELKDHGVNVNGVSPSTLDTPTNRESMPNADFSKWVRPQQVAEAIAFLASPAADAIHGLNVEVYGRA